MENQNQGEDSIATTCAFNHLFQSSLTINYFQASGALLSKRRREEEKKKEKESSLRKLPESGKHFLLATEAFILAIGLCRSYSGFLFSFLGFQETSKITAPPHHLICISRVAFSLAPLLLCLQLHACSQKLFFWQSWAKQCNLLLVYLCVLLFYLLL